MYRTGFIASVCFLGIVVLSEPVSADWRCQCGCIVHVNYPTTCPVCGRPLPNTSAPTPVTPPFTPPGSTGPVDASGLKLGVSVYSAGDRVVVSSVEAGTPAQGVLFPNDQIVRAAFRDAASGSIYRFGIRTPDDLTQLKFYAGTGTRVAMEVFRPTTGPRNFFVNFVPSSPIVPRAVYDSNGNMTSTTTTSRGSSAEIVEDSSGEAGNWLSNGTDMPVGGISSGNSGNMLRTDVQTGVESNNNSGGDSAGDLLNGNGR